MNHEGDGIIPEELFTEESRNEFLSNISRLHELNQVEPTIFGIELEERMRDYVSLNDEYRNRVKNNTDGRETEFIEDLGVKIMRLEEYIEMLQVKHNEEIEQTESDMANSSSSHVHDPKSLVHPGNLTIN